MGRLLRRSALPAVAALVLVAGCSSAGSTNTAAAPAGQTAGTAGKRPKVLFIRGANRSAGYQHGEGGKQYNDGDLADVVNIDRSDTQHGYGELAQMLTRNGYDVVQLEETAVPVADDTSGISGKPVDLAKADLGQYAAVVFGSNNAVYDAASIDAVNTYVRNGGGTLFISDANFGSSVAAAPISDNLFLNRWGVTMHQDNAAGEDHPAADGSGAFTKPDHPVLKGVKQFGSFGVSACEISPNSGFVSLVPFTTAVQVQQPLTNAAGPKRDPGPNDSALAVADIGKGRVACFYDRDPFFNAQMMHKEDHDRLALNLVNWLSHRS